jgi:hypothetical protein
MTFRLNTKITKEHEGPQNQNSSGAEAARKILNLSSWPFVLLGVLRVPSVEAVA